MQEGEVTPTGTKQVTSKLTSTRFVVPAFINA